MAKPGPAGDESSDETLRRDEQRLMSLFAELLHRHGLEKTRRMFENYSQEPTTVQDRNLGKLKMLQRLDGMPRPNIKRLVRELMADSGISPSDPKYQNQSEALDKQIRRLKKDRSKLETKFGTVSPPVEPGEPAKFRVLKREK